MEVKYIYSACIQVKTSDLTILTDPWFTDGAYDGSWYQFPKIDPFKYIDEPDYIYISHIHPDHYDAVFLNQLFEKFGKKPILIPDLKNNYLLFKGKFDGLEMTPTRELNIKNTSIYIEENDTGSVSDIDSALVIHDHLTQKTLLNLNDCIFNQNHTDKLNEVLSNLNTSLDLLALGYTGAGPFPQTYYDHKNNTQELEDRANQKKEEFFVRYRNYIKHFPATYNLPFAGEYILGGSLSHLNHFRGVSDAFEVKDFDSKALVLKNGGSVNLESNCINNERTEIYSNEEMNKRINDIAENKLDYEIEIEIPFNKINFLRLIKKSALSALKKSEIDFDYHFIITPTYENKIMGRFLVDCDNGGVKQVPLDFNPEDIKLEVYSEILIDYRYLFGLLTTVYHWNNAEVGSHFMTYRHPVENYNVKVQSFLNFFTAA